MDLVAFRVSGWDTPWWVGPNRDSGRFNPAGIGPVQYWCLHPLGPYAEYLRAQDWRTEDLLAVLRLRTWVAKIPDDGIVAVTFDNAEMHGLQAFDLISDDYDACQDFGAACLSRLSPVGVRVPSAALPGTENLILFGERVISPYLLPPVGGPDVPTSVSAEGAYPPVGLLSLVRFWGDPHAAYGAWTNRQPFSLREPSVSRTD